MTLDEDDIKLISQIVREIVNASGAEEIRKKDAMKILGVSSAKSLYNISQIYPEIKPAGKNSHFYSRTACLRVARVRAAKRNGRI